VLRAISGLVAPRRGSISHEGTDISGMGAHMIAQKGVIQVPGGRGVFPSLSVAENLKVALWMHRRDREYAKTATEEALNLFRAAEPRERPGRAASVASSRCSPSRWHSSPSPTSS
jgi:branched-chain amino acid transport system ATP-binding protein